MVGFRNNFSRCRYAVYLDGVQIKIPKLYGMEKITQEEVMNKLDIFQFRFGRIDEFVWWDLEIVSVDAGTQFTSIEFKE